MAASPEIVTSHTPQQDRWPVKVTIHSVDYERMSLSATMEAYNVPSHPHQHQSLLSGATEGMTQFTRTSSITTYLEGEILDFNTHTLLTESFKSTASNDATYWRKLPPFQMLTDEEMARNLTNYQWFNEVLNKEWILMRWKERCFVKSLNRSTADPQPSFSSTTAAPAVSTPPNTLHETNSGNGAYSSSGHYWENILVDPPLGTFSLATPSFDSAVPCQQLNILPYQGGYLDFIEMRKPHSKHSHDFRICEHQQTLPNPFDDLIRHFQIQARDGLFLDPAC